MRAPHSKTVAPDVDRILGKLRAQDIIDKDNMPKSRGILTVLEDHEIVEKYNQIILGFSNYYTHTTSQEGHT